MIGKNESSDSHDLKWLAYWLARHLLRNKVDKQGRPLIEHSMRVARTCADKGLSDEQQIAAILHDCAEDGELHERHLQPAYNILSIIDALFGSNVYRLVAILTKSKSMTYDKYINLISRVPETVPIKLADLADNLDPSRGPIPIPDSLRERYEKAQAYLQAQT